MAGSATQQTAGVGAHDVRDIRLSAGARRAATTPIGFAFYNIGLNNNEVVGSNWTGKKWTLTSDVRSIIEGQKNVHAIFLCEVGNMLDSIEDQFYYRQQADKTSNTPKAKVVEEFFDKLLASIGASTWQTFQDAPYVALVDISI